MKMLKVLFLMKCKDWCPTKTVKSYLENMTPPMSVMSPGPAVLMIFAVTPPPPTSPLILSFL